MDELVEISDQLCSVVAHRFPFFVPKELINEIKTIDILKTRQIKVNADFKEKFLDKMLIVNSDLSINHLTSARTVTEYNIARARNLERNCFRLVELKDTLNPSSYQFILQRYIQFVVTFDWVCSVLIDIYKDNKPVLSFNPTSTFDQQRIILQNHLNDLQNVVSIDGSTVNFEEVIDNLVNHFIKNPEILFAIKARNDQKSDIPSITEKAKKMTFPKNKKQVLTDEEAIKFLKTVVFKDINSKN